VSKAAKTKLRPRGKPWQPGQSGCPGGVAKAAAGKDLATLIREQVSPMKLLAALKRAAFKQHDRFALQLFCQYLAAIIEGNVGNGAVRKRDV
jgi:hypothetical protein